MTRDGPMEFAIQQEVGFDFEIIAVDKNFH